MKKIFIAALVGAIIFFVYTSLSWMALGVHTHTLKYTPAQDSIMQTLSAHLTENGMYGLPTTNPDADLSMDEMKKQHEAMMSKPWAMVLYNTNFIGMDPMMMVKGFILNLIAVLMVAWLLATANPQGFTKKWLLVMTIPVILITQSALAYMTFWQYPWHFVSGEIFDAIVGWGLTGLWLAWYMGRAPKTA